MFQQGVVSSHAPSPLFVMAILNFQDAAELFLHLACEHHQVAVPKQAQFLDYWKVLAAVGPVRHETGMDRLNRARVAFKHHGNLPNELDMEHFRVTIENFFEENALLLFGVSFKDVSLVELVQFTEARDQLKLAEASWGATKTDDSRIALARAFSFLLRGYQEKNENGEYRDPFDFGPSMTFLSGNHLHLERGPMKKFIDGTTEAIGLLQSALRTIALGIDYRRLVRFRSLTPTLGWHLSGHTIHMRDFPPLSKADFDFCFNFVIESAIKLQQFDYGA
jgi:hypothetical protein